MVFNPGEDFPYNRICLDEKIKRPEKKNMIIFQRKRHTVGKKSRFFHSPGKKKEKKRDKSRIFLANMQ